MSAIKENIVGLFRFSALLVSVFFLPKHKDQTIDEHKRLADEIEREIKLEKDKYDKYLPLVGPSVSLIPAEIKFCPRCHLPVCQLRRTKEGIQIIQDGRVQVTVGGNVIVQSDGKETRGFPIQCPNGHTVRIE